MGYHPNMSFLLPMICSDGAHQAMAAGLCPAQLQVHRWVGDSTRRCWEAGICPFCRKTFPARQRVGNGRKKAGGFCSLKGEHPRKHLKDFVGTLQADGYAGFDRLYNDRDPHHPIKEAACWAHVRRKFYDIHVARDSPIASEALTRIGELYGIEAEIRAVSALRAHAHRRTSG
jgi:Transposase IS66 family